MMEGRQQRKLMMEVRWEDVTDSNGQHRLSLHGRWRQSRFSLCCSLSVNIKFKLNWSLRAIWRSHLCTMKAFFKQPNLGKAKRPRNAGSRFWKNIFLSVKTPKEAIECTNTILPIGVS
ncbi:hypothetical protein ACQ4PT_072111 [Festuca glaucescens]